METPILIAAGEKTINAVLHKPIVKANVNLPVVIICHGFISNKIGQHRLFVNYAREICNAGFAVLRFDYPGCGESSGKHSDITFKQQVHETRLILDYIAADKAIDQSKIILLGHSFGGAVAASVAGNDERVSKLILWSPVAKPLEDIVGIIGKELYEQVMNDEQGHYQGFELGKSFFKSLMTAFPLETVKNFFGDVLIVHGGADEETPLENAHLYEAFLRARLVGKETLKIIDAADHTYSTPAWENAAINLTRDWLMNQFLI